MANDGKFIEKNIGKALTNLLGKEAVVVRLHDTKSAAFFLPPSPADFMGIFKGGIPVLIEAKSSDEHISFTDCNVKEYLKATQYAYHRMWMNQGGMSIFMFHSILTKRVEYWNGKDILAAYRDKWTAGQKVDSGVEKTAHTVKAIEEFLPFFVDKLNKYRKEEE